MNVARQVVIALALMALIGGPQALGQYDGNPSGNRVRVLTVANMEGTDSDVNERNDRMSSTNVSRTNHVAAVRKTAGSSESFGAFPALVPSRPANESDASASENEANPIAGPAVTVTSSLAVVLGLFAGLIWLTRRFGSRSLNQRSLPQDVMQSLGSANLDTRTKVTMLRCGSRIVILAQNASGVYPISEVTDPDEVRQLIASCAGDSQRSFAQTLQTFEQEPTPPGFVEHEDSAVDNRTARRRGRLFATA